MDEFTVGPPVKVHKHAHFALTIVVLESQAVEASQPCQLPFDEFALGFVEFVVPRLSVTYINLRSSFWRPRLRRMHSISCSKCSIDILSCLLFTCCIAKMSLPLLRAALISFYLTVSDILSTVRNLNNSEHMLCIVPSKITSLGAFREGLRIYSSLFRYAIEFCYTFFRRSALSAEFRNSPGKLNISLRLSISAWRRRMVCCWVGLPPPSGCGCWNPNSNLSRNS